MQIRNFPWDTGITIITLAIAAIALPIFHPSSYAITMLSLIGIYAIALKGLDFVTGYTGELSVGHAALFGIGAYTAGWLNLHVDMPMLLTIPTAIAFTAGAAWLISFPLLRVNGPFLVLTTLAFGRIVYIFLSQTTAVTGGQGGMQLTAQSLFDHVLGSTDYYYIILIALIFSTWTVHAIAHSKMGRAFEALRDSPIATDCMGIGTAHHKQKALVLSGVFGGLAGVLYAYSQGILFPDSFGFEMSLMLLMAVLFGGKKSMFGPILGATFIVAFPDVLGNQLAFQGFTLTALCILIIASLLRIRCHGMPSIKIMLLPLLFTAGLVAMAFLLADLNEYRLAIYGGIILMVVSYLRNGILGLLPPYIPSHKSVSSDGTTGIQRISHTSDKPLLEVKNITMEFNGLKALSNVSFSINPGTIMDLINPNKSGKSTLSLLNTPGTVLGLIGPNGAGKSTILNILTALYRPTGGVVTFDGHHLAHVSTANTARLGISRTFQNLQTFGDLSLLDNVLAGMHHHIDAQSSHRAMALLDTVGLVEHAHRLAKTLSYGQQRLLEIARALATNPKLLLLDEPAAGLRGPDLAALKKLIATIKAHGISMILIEHHMDVIMDLSDKVVVLNFGQLLASGTPEQIQANQAVQEAYLGS